MFDANEYRPVLSGAEYGSVDRFRSFLAIVSVTWEYVFAVTPTSECPNASDTVTSDTPLARLMVANV